MISRNKVASFTINKLKLAAIFLFIALSAPFVMPATAHACDLYQSTPVTQIIVPWYKYLEGVSVDGECRVVMEADDFTNGKNVSLIAIAVIELITRVSGLIAVGYVIYGAFQYILSQGEPEGLKNAKNTITNALIGFIVILFATAILQFLGRALK